MDVLQSFAETADNVMQASPDVWSQLEVSGDDKVEVSEENKHDSKWLWQSSECVDNKVDEWRFLTWWSFCPLVQSQAFNLLRAMDMVGQAAAGHLDNTTETTTHINTSNISKIVASTLINFSNQRRSSSV